MASVSSLDKDLRKLRLDKYTPAAANEARAWIEGILGERLPTGDLLDGLKDGVALCRLVNLALPPPGVKFKQSAMPFVQMENISHFLRACQQPPLNLQQHDMFLTVDLYEQKDPAQVLQCLGAFSRAANQAAPHCFPTAIGPKKGSLMSPQNTGPGTPTPIRGRGISNASNGSSAFGSSRPVLTATKTGDSNSGRWSPTKSPPNGGSTSPGVSTSSWSRREHEGATAPAWNIAQYGYMGGASQGNLGIAFGGRRQITSAGPHVPNLAEKERMRREKAAEEERQRQQMEEEERRRKAELEAEEERARLEEERRWEEETRRLREEEKRKQEEEQRRWEEEERQWKLTEERRRREEEEAEAKLDEDRRRARSRSRNRDQPALRGQYLSQYQAEEAEREASDTGGYRNRVMELEKELELARQREQEYERERQERSGRSGRPAADSTPRPRSRSRPRPPSRQDSWSKGEREYLRTQWSQQQVSPPAKVVAPPVNKAPRPLPDPNFAVSSPAKVKTHRTGDRQQEVKSHRTGERTQEVKSHRTGERTQEVKSHRTGERAQEVKSHRTGERSQPEVRTHHTGSRPLPDPAAYGSAGPPPPPRGSSANVNVNRTDRFLAGNPAPAAQPTHQTYSRELGATAERDAEDRRRAQSQAQTKAGGWASKSLLEREMEMERQRQREWEEAQKETAKAVRQDNGVDGIGGGVGGRWDVGQWSGYTGGDSQNKGAQGIGAGRRQIVGPRPLPGPNR